MKNSLIAKTVFMVAPVSFGFDEQTAASNIFQHRSPLTPQEIRSQALHEFDGFVNKLRTYNINVITFYDKPTPPKPDAVFPNNWLSTWPDGKIYLYPMATTSRRIERSQAALDTIRSQHTITEVIDVSEPENDGRFLESTGVMVFDHAHRRVYACLSVRCDEKLLHQHAAQLGYKPVIFHAATEDGMAIYHTNVMLAIQAHTAVVCAEAITDTTERQQVLDSLRDTGHTVVEISLDQMRHFCGNVLEVQDASSHPCLVMSQAAYDSFTPAQRSALAANDLLIPVAIPTIETIGGGSARCMMAEVFLPVTVPVRATTPQTETLTSATA